MLNGKESQFDAPVTVGVLLHQVIPHPEIVAVEVNGQVVPRRDHSSYKLGEGDQVEVVTFVGGG